MLELVLVTTYVVHPIIQPVIHVMPVIPLVSGLCIGTSIGITGNTLIKEIKESNNNNNNTNNNTNKEKKD